MIKIQHALWGYSSGHHLLASSASLSNQSIKMLEPLTDLSGSEMVSAFDGYLTGCPLQSDNYYALSKTWYANEMSRPGCVWTHTLLLDYSSVLNLRTIDLESLFQRPNCNEVGWKDQYSKPIYVSPQSENERIFDSNVCKVALNMFSLMAYHLEPIIIAATSVDPFNNALELLIAAAGLEFFSDISFCTGSFSNRTINRIQLDLQIVPANLSKLISRTNQKGAMYTDLSENVDNLNNVAISNTITQEEFHDIKKFIFFCNSQYYRRCYWSLFKEVYKTIINLEDFSVSGTINILQNQLNKKDISTVIEKIFETIFSPIKRESEINPNTLIKALFDFLTIDEESISVDIYIADKTLIDVLNRLWTQYREQMLLSLPQLMDHNLNSAGEMAVKYLTTLVDLNDYSLLLLQNINVCSLMLRFNWKLALCEDVWKQPKNVQMEALWELRNFSDDFKSEKSSCYSIIYLIFKRSSYDLSDELYKTFGDLSVEAFFEWYDTRNADNSTLKLWHMLCKKNQMLSINKLESIQNPMLFEAVISILDPYDNNIKSTSPEIWERLYKRFCHDNKYSIKSEFAQFVLPIVLQTNYIFSEELLRFVFLTVHKLLANDSMDYYRWKKLSALLPEVTWFSSWDKCKRLRDAAKLRKYNIDFGNRAPNNKR